MNENEWVANREFSFSLDLFDEIKTTVEDNAPGAVGVPTDICNFVVVRSQIFRSSDR